MHQSPDYVFFDHTDRNAKLLGNLAMRIALIFVHDEGKAAGCGKVIERDDEDRQLPPLLVKLERIIGNFSLVEAVQVDTVIALTLLAQCEIDGCIATGTKQVGPGCSMGVVSVRAHSLSQAF